MEIDIENLKNEINQAKEVNVSEIEITDLIDFSNT